MGIVDYAESLVVEYKYNPWGKPTLVRTLTDTYEALADRNPFRLAGNLDTYDMPATGWLNSLKDDVVAASFRMVVVQSGRAIVSH